MGLDVGSAWLNDEPLGAVANQDVPHYRSPGKQCGCMTSIDPSGIRTRTMPPMTWAMYSTVVPDGIQMPLSVIPALSLVIFKSTAEADFVFTLPLPPWRPAGIDFGVFRMSSLLHAM
jgi:hypothetical protein